MQSADAATIRRGAASKGMMSLREDGAEKLLAGMTTVEEILRVGAERARAIAAPVLEDCRQAAGLGRPR